MNSVLERATIEDRRRANTRSELIALLFEGFAHHGNVAETCAFSSFSSVRSIISSVVLGVFPASGETWLCGQHRRSLEVCRVDILRFRTFQVLCLTLEQELPPLAKELSTPEKLWQKIKDLSEPEREQYLAGRTEHLP